MEVKMTKKNKNSPSIVYYLLEKKAITVAIVCILSFILRFALAYSTGWVDALGNALEFASIVSASVIAVLIFFKDAVNDQIVKAILKREHTVIFGLGEFNGELLKNEKAAKNRDCIIFEKNTNNDKLELFKKFSMGVVLADVFDEGILNKLNFENMGYGVISLGKDRLNVELATLIIEQYIKENTVSNKEAEENTARPLKLVVHIINQDLNALFHQKFISQSSTDNAKKSCNNLQMDIQTFSFYEEVAEAFFEDDHVFVDGENNAILNSDEDYHMVVAGNGELAFNIIYQAAKLAHLPNENKLTLHLVDKQASAFKNRVIKRYPGILEVISLEALDLDSESRPYFEQNLWFKKHLTHVIACYDDEERNLNLATDLFNHTYLSSAVEQKLTTRISFAIFNNYNMSAKVDADKDSFKQLFTFGDVKTICTRANLLDEKHELIAKLVHSAYAEKYNPRELHDLTNPKVLKEINDKWYNSLKLNKKLSNKSQSQHMDMKLKALGLEKVKSKKEVTELLSINSTLFDSTLKSERDSLGLDDKFIIDYSLELPKIWDDNLEPIQIKYFPKGSKESSCMLEKLIKAEHNRWNAFHHLNGWTYKEERSDLKKEHDCLKPLSEFTEPKLQLTVIYDLYSILYIPNYLANAGYEIIKRSDWRPL